MPNPNSLCFDAAFSGMDQDEIIEAHSYEVYKELLSCLLGVSEKALANNIQPLEDYDFHGGNYEYMDYQRKHRKVRFDPCMTHDTEFFISVFRSVLGKNLTVPQETRVNEVFEFVMSSIMDDYGTMCGMFDYCEIECSYLIATFRSAEFIASKNRSISERQFRPKRKL